MGVSMGSLWVGVPKNGGPKMGDAYGVRGPEMGPLWGGGPKNGVGVPKWGSQKWGPHGVRVPEMGSLWGGGPKNGGPKMGVPIGWGS